MHKGLALVDGWEVDDVGRGGNTKGPEVIVGDISRGNTKFLGFLGG